MDRIVLNLLGAMLAVAATGTASVYAGPFDGPPPIRLSARIGASEALAASRRTVDPVVLDAVRPVGIGRIEIRVDPGEVRRRVESYAVRLRFVGRTDPATLGPALVVVDFRPAGGPRPGSGGSPWAGPHDSERMLSAGNPSFTHEIRGWPEGCRPCVWQFDYRLELIGEPAAPRVSIPWELGVSVELRGTEGLEPGDSTRIEIAQLRVPHEEDTGAQDPGAPPDPVRALASEPVALGFTAQTPVHMHQIAVTTETADGSNLELRLLTAPEPEDVFHHVVRAEAPSSVKLPGAYLRSSNPLEVGCRAPCRRVHWLVSGARSASLDAWLHLRARSGPLGVARARIVAAPSAHAAIRRIRATGDPPYLRRTVTIEVVPIGERGTPVGLFAYTLVERLKGTHGCCPVTYALGDGRWGGKLDEAVLDSMYLGRTSAGTQGHHLQHAAPTSATYLPEWLHFLGTCEPAEDCRRSLEWVMYASDIARRSPAASQDIGLRLGAFALSTGGEDLRDRVRIDLRVD